MTADSRAPGQRLGGLAGRALSDLHRLALQAGAAAGVALADLATRGEHRAMAMRADAFADLTEHSTAEHDAEQTHAQQLAGELSEARGRAGRLGSALGGVRRVLRERGHEPGDDDQVAGRLALILDAPAPALAEVVDQLDADMARWARDTPEGAVWRVPELSRRALAMVLGARVSGWLHDARLGAGRPEASLATGATASPTTSAGASA